jgi:hypothetical protein
MRRTRWFVFGLLILALTAGVFGWGHLARVNAAPASTTGMEIMPPAPEQPEANPIIAVIPGNTETQYEQDPFETTRLRRATARVRTLLYVRQDGTVETKQVQ